MAYQADIVIAVRGAKELSELQKQVLNASKGVDSLTSSCSSGTKNLNNLQALVAKSAQTMRAAAVDTGAQRQAIDAYVRSLGVAEKAERNLEKAIQQRRRELGLTTDKQRAATAKNLTGSLRSAAIGGAFPLLFGQGGFAAAGGAVGGLLGGPAGGFAGSLVGTLIGDLAGQAVQVKELADEIGFSAEQTEKLREAFRSANIDVENFTDVIQSVRGVGLEIDDQAKAIALVTGLTDKYGASFDKVGKTVTSALGQGKVTQSTLNKLTSEGIDIQGELASKYNVSRETIIQMAKDGDISVQTLINTLVDMGNKGVDSANRPKSAMDKFKESVVKLGAQIAEVANDIVKVLTPVFNFLLDGITAVINGISRAISRFRDLQSGGKGLQADIQASEIAKKAAIEKYGITYGLTTQGNAYFKQQKEAALAKLRTSEYPAVKPTKLESFTVPTNFTPATTGTGTNEAQKIQNRIDKLNIETRALKEQAELRQKINQAELAGDTQLAARLKGEQDIQQILTKLQVNLVSVTDEKERQAILAKAAAEIDVSRIKTSGQLAEIEAERTKSIDEVLKGLDMEKLALKANTDEEKDALKFLEIENKLKELGIILTEGDTKAIQNKINELRKLTNEQKQMIAQQEMEQKLFMDISNTVANTFSSAIDAAVDSTKNFGDALKDLGSDLLATIGNMLIMYGIGQALGALGGGDDVGILSFLAMGFGYKPAAQGAYMPGGFEAFANGGIVSSPTLGMIGEGGASEYVIPENKMTSAMSRWNSGVRGDALVSGAEPTGGAGGVALAAAPTNIVVEGGVLNFNDSQYIRQDQVPSIVKQASAAGEAMALRKLQMSTATRKRIGL